MIIQNQTTDLQKLPYRKGVGLCLFNKSGQVFIAERRDMQGAWQMPQGGVQKDEDPAAAALRELKEEIGTDNAKIIGRIEEPLRYEFPDWLQKRRIVHGNNNDLIFKGKYRGQEQIWFALLFLGEDTDIDLSGKFETEKPEFVRWKWASIEEALGLIVSFKRTVYERIVRDFAPLAEKIIEN
ncbi:MAG: RNA pyrophosphohydrolase [Alphaproteobacteria bacterium]|nr:RNA pyrophosphohydrolase [Alphaproteobacteria bacterium]MCL2505539.1 RNA pyrophosphohydrolase [Alphaproteobacteria bacterium]